MMQIGTIGRTGTVRMVPGAPERTRERAARAEPSRALVVLDGGRADAEPPTRKARVGRPSAGFLTQMIVDADPGLRPSRLERTQAAAARYAEAARRLA